MYISVKDLAVLPGTAVQLPGGLYGGRHLHVQVLYCTVLYCTVFMVADIFMCSIDSITSATKRVLVASKDGATEEVEVPVWDGTLANL